MSSHQLTHSAPKIVFTTLLLFKIPTINSFVIFLPVFFSRAFFPVPIFQCLSTAYLQGLDGDTALRFIYGNEKVPFQAVDFKLF
jgi:hypothetical protein